MTTRFPSDTPRTDSFLSTIPDSTQWYVFCRELERELAAAPPAPSAERVRETVNRIMNERGWRGNPAWENIILSVAVEAYSELAEAK